MEIFGVGWGALRGKRIAILAADGFEYIELIIPKHALWWARARVDVISLHEGNIRGMNLTEPTRTVRVDHSLDVADAERYDGLFIVGGFVGPDFLRQSQRARELVRAFDDARKPIATLCHGPWLLVSAGLVGGRVLAAWPGIRDDIVHAGGIWRDQSLVCDQNWLSSRGPQDLREFIPAMIALFAGDKMKSAEAQDLNVPSSPAPLEPFQAAVSAARLMPGPALLTLAAASLGTGMFGLLRRFVSRPS
jgi:protease I